MGSAANKKLRQTKLQTLLAKNPFLTDENLAEQFDVSIQTIRLDRLALGIPELRERTRYMAENAQKKLQSITSDDIVGELIDLEIGVSGISMMTVTKEMVLQKTGVARGQYMFAQANSLALAVIDAPAAVTGVANVKYKIPVYSGSVLVARAEVKRKQEDKYTIWVKIRNNRKEVFRAKFLITALPEERNQENENRG
ncbi:MAG: transcription factor FapR [Acidaminococcus sp.]|jgi:acyl-coenzyme A thioesterase PaaI-like protein|nr:transcription factor FapR [Acidaminococcus sp.]MCI2101018.1 transcription factor FapR [Acidaminococcus sp.]MCI2117519.1 transcription factor FapR [Acidaminococcus sp.]